MDITELREAKAQLEMRLNEVVNRETDKFHEETGIPVAEVYVHAKMLEIGDAKTKFFIQTNLRLGL